nr:Uma2 family endonuclease [uncultured Desulfobacter sp.]
MTPQPQEKKNITPAEYLAMERVSLDIKHEFFDGEIFAMVGAKINHVRINANLTREIGNKFKAGKSPCEVLSNDMRVKIETGYVYPDIVIHCGDAAFEDNEFDTLTNPVVIIEILSDSTEAFDRGKKFAYYRAISTLQEYILVSQEEYLVEQFKRSDAGKWEYRSYEDADHILKMESINCELPLSEIYWDVEFKLEQKIGPP